MQLEEPGRIGPEAAEQFNRHEGRSDGMYVAGRLTSGLTTLRDCLFVRLHEDVERLVSIFATSSGCGAGGGSGFR